MERLFNLETEQHQRVFPTLNNITQCTHAVCWLMHVLEQYKPWYVCPFSLFNNWHRFNIAILFGFFKCWTQSLWRRDRAHKNTAKCYNTDRSNFTPAFSITFFALEACQVSFTWNVRRNELTASVMCWFVGTAMRRRKILYVYRVLNVYVYMHI